MNIGDKVIIKQDRAGAPTAILGRGVVARVTPRKIVLADGSEWRSDGYFWGSKPTRGLGRAFERRIELDKIVR